MDTTTARQIEAAEDAYTAYLRQHYGPLWGETNEVEAEALRARLDALYTTHDVPEFDRVAL